MSKFWTHLADIESESEAGKTYEVKRHTVSGRLGCACRAYRFARGSNKTCKHIKAYLKDEVSDAMADTGNLLAPKTVPVTVTVTVDGERMTVRRRGITFGPIR